MTVVTRTIGPEDVEAWIRTVGVGFLDFLDNVAAADAEFRRSHSVLDYARTYGAFEGERCVATFRSFPTELTLPGEQTLVVSAVTAVTVSPSHRRRGLLTDMMRTDLQASVDRGEPAAILVASEWPIYGRFGFGAATEAVTYELDKTRASLPAPAAHSFEHVTAAELVKLAPAVFERHRTTRPGSIDRNRPSWWEINFSIEVPPGYLHPWKGFCVVARDANGDPQGYLRYHVDDHWDDRVCLSTLLVDELTAANDAATRDLWRFAAGVDLTVKVKAEQRPVDEWIGWELTDARAFRQLSRADLLWLRILDVPCLLEARRYFTTGSVTIDVLDELGYASGRFTLEASPEGARCRPTDRSPDLRLPARSLGSILLGGHSPATLARAGAIEEVAPGAAARAAALFWSPIAPWCGTWF